MNYWVKFPLTFKSRLRSKKGMFLLLLLLQSVVALGLVGVVIWFAYFSTPFDNSQHSKTGLLVQMFLTGKVTVVDASGQPASGAIVSLDNQQVLADSAGAAYFTDIMLHDNQTNIIYKGEHYQQHLHVHSDEVTLALGMSEETKIKWLLALSCLLTGWLGVIAASIIRWRRLTSPKQRKMPPKETLRPGIGVAKFFLHQTRKVSSIIALPCLFALLVLAPFDLQPKSIKDNLVQAATNSLAVPVGLSVEQDDNNAILTWNSPLTYDYQDPPGVVGYRISWGLAGQPLSNVQITHYRILQLQPLINGQPYQVQVQSVDANGNLSTPSSPLSFTGDPSRVNALRQKMTGFFDDFNRPAGALDELKWNQAYSRCADENLNFSFINAQFHAHNHIIDSRCDRGQVVNRPRSTFDFTGRTGTITFDMDGLDRRNTWYLDLMPQLLDLTSHVSGDDIGVPAFPSQLLRFRQAGSRLDIVYNGEDGTPQYLATTDYNPYPPLDETVVGLPLVHNVRRHWQIQISQSRTTITINGKEVLSAVLALPFSKATVQWNEFSYNTAKANMPYALLHWDNFGFDGSASNVETHNYRTAGYGGADFVSTSEYVAANTQIKIPDVVSGAKAVRLMYTLQMDGGDYVWSSSDRVVINGQSFSLPQPSAPAANKALLVDTLAAYSVVMPLPAGVIVSGVNQLSFVGQNSGIMNIHVELDYAKGGSVPVYTQPDQINATASHPMMAEVGAGVSIDRLGDKALDVGGTSDQAQTQMYGVSGVVGVEWTAQHDIAMGAMGSNPGIARVQLRLNGAVIYELDANGNSSGAPYEHGVYELDTRGYANGVYKLDIVAYNPSGVASIPDYFASDTKSGDYYPILINITNVGTPIPTKPTNLIASIISGSQINLTWHDASANETGFYLERKLGVSGSYVRIATLAANSTSYQDTGLLDGTSYYYRIASYNNVGTSAYSNEANVLTPLVAPSNLSVTPVTLIQLRIAWSSNSINESGFQIERKTGVAGVYTLITTVSAHTTSFDDIGLLPATTYYYRVRAVTPFTNSGYTAEQSNTTMATANYTVTMAADSGAGSLRDVLNTISVALPSNVTILLSLTPGSSITINSSLPALKQGLTIVGNCDSSGPTISIKGGLATITGLSLGGNNVIYGLAVNGFSGPGISNSGKGNHLKCVSVN